MVGFIRGILWGGVVAVGGLVALSQLVPPSVPVSNTENPTEPQAGADTQVQPKTDAEPASLPTETENSAPPAQAEQPLVTETEPEVKAVDNADVAPVLPVEPAAEPPAAANAPVNPPDVLAKAPEAQDAVPTEPSPSAPPVNDAAAPMTTPTPALAEPASSDPVVEQPKAPQRAPDAPPSDAPVGDMAKPLPEDQPTAEVAVASSQVPATAAPAGPAAPEKDALPDAVELPPPPPLSPEEEALLQPAPTEETPPSTAAVEPAEPPPSVLPPAPSLTDEAEGVITGRLPRIGEADSPEATEAAVPDAVAVPVDDESLPPLQRFARAFENPDQKPLFAILMQDNGGDVDRAALAALELPLTVIIDPLSEGAVDHAAIWRSGGQEVVMSAESVPAGATPGDLEQMFQALASRLPESVAVIDVTGSVFQSNRQLAAQIVPILADQGRGLVTFDQGLNAADQVARREGLASVTIFRRFDPDQAEAPAVKRYLDRAVFKAAQEGQVAVIGTLSPETVAGLLEWSIEGRASTVAVAPISALLLRDR